MEIYSRGIQRRNGFPRGCGRGSEAGWNEPLLCNSLATLAPRRSGFPLPPLRCSSSGSRFRRMDGAIPGIDLTSPFYSLNRLARSETFLVIGLSTSSAGRRIHSIGGVGKSSSLQDHRVEFIESPSDNVVSGNGRLPALIAIRSRRRGSRNSRPGP